MYHNSHTTNDDRLTTIPMCPPHYLSDHRIAYYTVSIFVSCPNPVPLPRIYAANGSNRAPAATAFRKFVHTSRSFCERAIRKRHVNSTTISLVIWCR